MVSHDKQVQSVVQKIIHGRPTPKALKPFAKPAVATPFPVAAKKKTKVSVPEAKEVEPAGTPEAGEHEIHIHIHR